MPNMFNKFGKNFNNAEMQSFSNNIKNSDYFTSEFEINDAPVGARNLLTKGFVQDEINQCSGAAISTRGRFMAKGDSRTPAERPLYLFIQGPTKQSIELAIQKIDEIIRTDIGNPIRPGFSALPGARLTAPGLAPPQPSSLQSSQPPQPTHVEKLFIGLDGLPAALDLRGKIIGQGGSNLHYIRSETGAAVTLRGRGSQFMDPALGRETAEPLHLFLEHPRPEGLAAARGLAVNLVETLLQELQVLLPDLQHHASMTPAQVLSMPPRNMGAPPLSVPPPQQPMEQPMLLTNGPGNTLQLQQQAVLLQQPPPMSRPPVVSIPPPGIHIPQHAGPLVPPPQLVQLSGPPPSASGSGNVLVVGPPPTQPMYLPPELASASSSSINTFSLLQGGVFYQQAPPVQTQAQIGDGLHIITAQTQQGDGINVSMSPHTQPPPQMIITQVQMDPNNQMLSQGNQDSNNFQQHRQPVISQQHKTQYHVIGHVQGQLNQEQGISVLHQSQSQIVQQNQDMQNVQENFNHFQSGNQISSCNSMVMTLPYNFSNASNNSNMTTITAAMSQHMQEGGQLGQTQTQQYQQQLSLQGQQQDALKAGHRALMHVGQQRNERGPIMQMQQNQSCLDQMPSNPNMINQMPPQQLQMSDQMPPSSQMQNNNQQTTSQMQLNVVMGNQHQQQHQLNQQPAQMMVAQQAQMPSTAAQQMNQMPPNQFTVSQNPMTQQHQLQQDSIAQQPGVSQQQMTQQMIPPNQQQFNQMPFNQNPYDQMPPRQDSARRQDNPPRNRSNQGGRSRRASRNSRQNVYPWSKNDQDKAKYLHTDPIWLKREGQRDETYERKNDDYPRASNDSRSRYQGQEQEAVSQLEEEEGRPPGYRSGPEGERAPYEASSKGKGNTSPPASNKGGRPFFQQHYEESNNYESTPGNWNRGEKSDGEERSPDSGRKRRYDSEIPWKNNRSENGAQKPAVSGEPGKSGHKKRFDQEEYPAAGAGSQNYPRSGAAVKNFVRSGELIKAEKGPATKWSDQPGEQQNANTIEKVENRNDAEENQTQKKDSPAEDAQQSHKDNVPEKTIEKPLDALPASQPLPTEQPTNQWGNPRPEIKANMEQYAHPGHFQGQNMNSNDRQFNQHFQPGYLNTTQMFQGNLPYLLPPPPPPPPAQQQQQQQQLQPQQQQQHGLQFNLAQSGGHHNTPPNMSMGSSLGHQGQGQMTNMGQGMGSAHMQMQNMPPNAVQSMTNNGLNQNMPFDMPHGVMGSHNMGLNANQNMPLGMMGQNAMGQNVQPNIGHQNISANMQMVPNSLQGGMPPNMGQTMVGANVGQNLSPYMGQNIPNNIHQHLGQNMMGQHGGNGHMGQHNTGGQNMNPNMGQGIAPLMGQNASAMGHGMPFSGHTANIGQSLPMGMSNNNLIGQNMMGMQNMGQMGMGPTMVPPPPNMTGGGNVPNMVPPPTVLPPGLASRGAAPPPPPPPNMHNLHNMPSQPPYPYWMG